MSGVYYQGTTEEEKRIATTMLIEENNTLKQQLANATKQIAAMRERLLTLVWYAEESNDCQYGTLSTRLVLDIAQDALAATDADFKNCILCDAEPIAHLNPYGGVLQTLSTGLEKSTYTIPLYKARKP